MNVTIERLYEKLGRLHFSQQLLIDEHDALKAVVAAVKAELEKIEKDAEMDVSKVLARIKSLLP